MLGCVVCLLCVGNMLVPSQVDAHEADFVPQARVHQVVVVPFGPERTVVHRPKVKQVLHGVRACCCSEVRVCRGM